MSSLPQSASVPLSPSPAVPRCPRNDDACPHPRNDSLAEIEFTPEKKMVDWLDPAQLARTGMKAANAATFGSYADKRELQAAMADIAGVDGDYSEHQGDLWFDYAADTGDGFDATYAVARLLSSSLDMNLGYPLERGRFLILGGDQVYPTASRDEYQNRFIGPFRAAFPYAAGGQHPHMYAVPGNHDWYDGLTGFLRIFCQKKSATQGGRWIGGWETNQRRSYFSIRLPNHWWIWAIDSQLESDMDHPQLQYFDSLVEEMLKVDPDPSKHKVILLAAEPGWVHCASDDAAAKCRRHVEAFNTLAHFEKRYIRSRGFQLKLVLSGDLHHYVRYAERNDDPAQPKHTVRVTAGGAGAYLLGTEEMPSAITIREGTKETVAAQEPSVTYKQASAFPTAKESLGLKAGIWKIPWQNWKFGLLIGALYLLFAWLLQSGSRGTGLFNDAGGSLLAAMQTGGVTWKKFFQAVLFTPLSAALGVLIIVGMYAFTAGSAKGYSTLGRRLGWIHGPAHLALAIGIMWLIAWALRPLRNPNDLRFDVTFTVAMMLLGWFLGSWLFAVYVSINSALTGVHQNEVFSAQYLTGYKHFLRMRLRPNGELTVHTIGLRNVPDDWQFLPPGDACGRPWFQSQKAVKEEYRPEVVDSFTVR